MNIFEAIEIMHKETNGMLPIGGCESKHYYFFVPCWANGQLVGNSSNFVINKDTGKSDWHTMLTPMDTVSCYVKYPDDGPVENSTFDEDLARFWKEVKKQRAK